MRKQKGQMGGGTTGMVVTVVIVAIIVIIGALVYSFVRNAITPSMSSLGSTQFNTTVANVDTNTYAGFDLLSVAAIVLAAVAIIAIILLLRALT